MIVPKSFPFPSQEWSKKISNEVIVRDGMTHVPQPKFQCDCPLEKKKFHEEL